MFNLVTPRQLSQRAELYHQLASLISAGVTMSQACRVLLQSHPSLSLRKILTQLQSRLEDGFNITESLESLGKWMSTFDIALVSAGEQSGRLDQCYRLLANYYQDRAQLLRSIISELTYPVFVLHMAIFIFPLPRYFLSGNWSGYFAHVFSILLPIYGLILAISYLFQGRRGKALRAMLEQITFSIPLLGTARRELAIARLSAALEALISAGVPIVQAWDIAAPASGSPALEKAVAICRPEIVSMGRLPSEVLLQSPAFPTMFSSMYATGEISGKLDQTLRKLHELYQESASRKLHAVAAWTPRLVFIGIALMIGYQVIRFYMNYFNQILNVIQ